MVKVMTIIIKFENETIKSSLSSCSGAYVLVTGDIMVTGYGADTDVAFRNCPPFIKCTTHINHEHIDGDENIDTVMSMYNLIQYSDNYSETLGILWQFKRDVSPVTNDSNPDNVTTNNLTSFKNKSNITGKTCYGW